VRLATALLCQSTSSWGRGFTHAIGDRIHACARYTLVCPVYLGVLGRKPGALRSEAELESTVKARGGSRRSRSLVGPGRRDQAAAGFLIAVMVIGSPVLWVGVPAASSWAAAQLTSDQTTHLQITVPLAIAGMVLFARFLFWVDKLYLRILARGTGLEPEDEAGQPRFMRGPLEPILVFSLVIAVIALIVWFFAFAENPPQQVF
jgi:hypothetical protein